MKINFLLNGRSRTIDERASKMLYDILRSLGINSVKKSCETGNCGCCTVIMNGLPVLSCTIPAYRLENSEIYTIEGMEREVSEFEKYLAAEGADQCGFCSSGFIVNVMYIKNNFKTYDEEKIKEQLSGNLCRCTGYVSQLRAIENYIKKV